MSRRPMTIAEVARRRAAWPNAPLWLPLNGFLDEFYERENPDVAMLQEEPNCVKFDLEDGAYLAAATEYLCTVYKLAPPPWIELPTYFLTTPCFPAEFRHSEALRKLFLAESPTAFRRRLIFTERYPLRRKLGPPADGDDLTKKAIVAASASTSRRRRR